MYTQDQLKIDMALRREIRDADGDIHIAVGALERRRQAAVVALHQVHGALVHIDDAEEARRTCVSILRDYLGIKEEDPSDG